MEIVKISEQDQYTSNLIGKYVYHTEGLTEEELGNQAYGMDIFNNYLIYKYSFMQTKQFKECENYKACYNSHLFTCGCFMQYLNEMYAHQHEIQEQLKKEEE